MAVADHVQRMPECNGVLELVAFQWGASLALPLLQQPGRIRAAVLFDVAADRSDRWVSVATPADAGPHRRAGSGRRRQCRGAGEAHPRPGATVRARYVYPGLTGGFALETSEKRYNKDAAELAFDRMIRFLKRRA